jgi:hypothetical protein
MTIRSMAVCDAEELQALDGGCRDEARDDRALALDVCSVCLRVRTGERWGEASEFIRMMRTWELPIVPQFASVLCASCTRRSSGQAIETDRRERALAPGA